MTEFVRRLMAEAALLFLRIYSPGARSPKTETGREGMHMDKPGYTTGPWHAETSGMVFSADGTWIAEALLSVGEYRENARLIAAAPQMFEALQALVADCERVAKYSWKTWMGGEWHWNDDIWECNDPDEFKLIKAARAALAKATGGRNG